MGRNVTDPVIQFRRKRGLSISDFAKLTGLSRQLIHHHDKYPGTPWRRETAQKIAAAVGGDLREEELVLGRKL